MTRLRYLIASLVLLGLGSMVIFEVDPSLKYEMRSDQFRWIGHKIFDPSARIDVLFIGTSRTWCAVDAIALNERFPNLSTITFGKNWHGREADYALIEDLLKQKKVKKIVLEVNHNEAGDTHNFTKFIGHPWDVSLGGFHSLRWRDYLMMSKQFKWEVQVQLEILLAQPVKAYYLLARRLFIGSFRNEDFSGTDATYGYLMVPVSPEDEQRFWNDIKGVPERYETDPDPNPFIRDRYVADIAELARAHGAELYFLLVPARNEAAPGPKYRALLDRLGTFVDLRGNDLYRYDLWRDPNHLNRQGAVLFSERVASSAIFAGAGGGSAL